MNKIQISENTKFHENGPLIGLRGSQAMDSK